MFLPIVHFCCSAQAWQVVGSFRIRCRIEDVTRVVNAAEQKLRLGLQLYRVQRGIYLLDLHLVKGDAFTFLNSCARVIAELKVPAASAPPPPTPACGTPGVSGGAVAATAAGAAAPVLISTGSISGIRTATSTATKTCSSSGGRPAGDVPSHEGVQPVGQAAVSGSVAGACLCAAPCVE